MPRPVELELADLDAVDAVVVFHAFCNDMGVHFVGNNVFRIIHVALIVNVIHDALDVLNPCFHFNVGDGLVKPVKHSVRGSFRVRAAAQTPFLFPSRALFAVGSLRMTPVKHRDRIFHALSLGKIVLGQLQLVGFVNEVHDLRVIALHVLELRGFSHILRMLLSHFFKLGSNLQF